MKKLKKMLKNKNFSKMGNAELVAMRNRAMRVQASMAAIISLCDKLIAGEPLEEIKKEKKVRKTTPKVKKAVA